jgi:hypothetical protein
MSFSSIPSNQESGLPIFRGRRGVAVFALVAVVVLGASYAAGVGERAETLRQAASAFESATRSLCTDVGIAAASDAYARCIDRANDLRQRDEQRIRSEFAAL